MKTQSLFASLAALALAFVLVPTAEAQPVTLTAKNFDSTTAKGVVLLDFWAEWCGPCKVLAPTIDKIAREYKGRVVVGKIDIEAQPGLKKRFKVNAYPTLKILKDGKEVGQIVGVAPKPDIEKALKKHLK
jgi:thioredoxin 1